METHPKQVVHDSYSDDLKDSVWRDRERLRHVSWSQVRYHRRRQRFFDLMDKASKALTLLFGATLFGKFLLTELAIGISAISLMALVFGYGDRKQTHKELAELAAALTAQIEGLPESQLTREDIAAWSSDLAKLSGKAPPPLRTLTILCEREQSLADGKSPTMAQPWFWRRLLSQIKS